jgi:hypothetical protein
VLPFEPASCWRALEQRRPVVLGGRSALVRSLVAVAELLHGGQVKLPRPVEPAGRRGKFFRLPGAVRGAWPTRGWGRPFAQVSRTPATAKEGNG